MHHADITASLKKSGIPPIALARRERVSPSAVSRVIHGLSKSRRLANRIADITGIPVSELWPGRYDYLRRAA